MKIASTLNDLRIGSENVLLEMSMHEYTDLIKGVISKNEFQRRKVGSSKTVYALLRDDLLKECIIPPIVLALTKKIDSSGENLPEIIDENKDSLVILDGLQRTHTILDLLKELEGDNGEGLSNFLKSKIRVEVYIGLNRLGILYRMLTLNTGQTPMSLRQQIEMLYLDYAETEIEGIELIKESDNKSSSDSKQYNFKEIVEGFISYLERDELPIEKADILENIRSLEKLSKEDQGSELFEKYLSSLDCVFQKFIIVCNEVEISEDYISEHGNPFGKTAERVFKRPQSISGFGSAIGKLIDFGVLEDIEVIKSIACKISCESPEDFLMEINDALIWLKENSKKIGNAQRSFFTFFYRDLFNKESDAYLDLTKSVKSGLRKYQSQNM